MPKIVKLKSSLIFEIYENAKLGLNRGDVAEMLKFDIRYLRTKLWAKRAYKWGRRKFKEKDKGGFNFADYVCGRLPSSVRKIWDEIMALDETDNGTEKIEAILQKGGTRARQNLFIHALISTNFNRSAALRICNLSSSAFKNWCRHDPEFSKMIVEVDEIRKDFIEGKLYELINDGDTKAVLFASKTKNKDRGYGETKKIDIGVSGQITHANMQLESLPLDLRMKVLEALRERKQIESKDVTPNLIESAANNEIVHAGTS
jgi:hypothetical protein